MAHCRLLDQLSRELGPQLALGEARSGRLKELLIANLYTYIGNLPYRAATLAIFCGRLPFYRPWIEIYNIQPVLGGERSDIPFIASPMESRLLDAVSKVLAPGNRVFMEYYQDRETLIQLEHGAPVIASRLGYELYRRGFTWFKVWYYPEGFNEGGQKIQAEKPLDEKHKRRHLEEHLTELRTFLSTRRIPSSPEDALAYSRARRIAREIESLLG